MKKISLIFASIIAMLSLGSCEEDTYPRLEPDAIAPEQDILNTPATADMYYNLAETETVNLTCRQPEFGFSALTTYKVQVSLSPEFKSVAMNEDGETAAPGYVELNTAFTTTSMHVPCGEIAEAICALRGIQSEEGYTEEGARPLYIRLRAYIAQAEEETSVISNIISLKAVKSYFAVRLPGYIWLIGQPEGWDINGKAEWRLFEAEDAIDSKVYYGTFDIPAGNFQFRFYTATGDWESNSIGAQVEDNPVNIELTDGVYSGVAVEGKGSWQVADWAGGTVSMTVNLENMTIRFEQVTE